ncbi:MAG TPA: hypothetical protein VH684_28810 [Xanthobacteraceae bacterium]|jgi:hypothetical protein
MRKLQALLIVALLGPLCAEAKTITVRGEGYASCNMWTQEHAIRSRRQPVQDSWVLGYVNAAASMLDFPDVDDVSAPFHNADLITWIDDYCSSHPDDPLIRAADALMRDLARRAQGSN